MFTAASGSAEDLSTRRGRGRRSSGVARRFARACVVACALPGYAAGALLSIDAARIWPATDYTRVTLESSEAIAHTVFTLDNPERVVIDLENVRANVLNAFAENDKVVPVTATEPGSRLVGDPARREELRLGGGHVTFATGRHAFRHTLPALTEWIAAHSDELKPPKER